MRRSPSSSRTTSVPSRSRATSSTDRAYQSRGSGAPADGVAGGPRSGPTRAGAALGRTMGGVTDEAAGGAAASDHHLADLDRQERAQDRAEERDDGAHDRIADA